MPFDSQFVPDDYTWAILHLAWWRNGDKNERTLVFGFVELLPHEYPKPDNSAESHKQTRNISEKSALHYQRIALKAEDAIDWYESAFLGKLHHPIQKGDPLKTSPLQQEPLWPALSFAENIGDRYPFVGNKWGNIRTHSAYATKHAPELERIFASPEYTDWLAEQFLFDFFEFPLLHGSLHCIAPNPVLRRFDVTLGLPTKEHECVDIHIIPREGYELDGLTLIYEEITANGIGVNKIIPLSDPFLRIHHAKEVGQITTSVHCERRGLLAREGPHGFLKSINFQTNIHSGKKEITIPASGRRNPEKTYTVPHISSGSINSIIGTDQSGQNIQTILHEEQRQRETKRDATRLGQKWFHNNQVEAETFIRNEISKAKQRVWIIDPYLATREFFSFVLAVTRSEVTIRILSSAEVLKKKSAIDETTDIAGEVFQQQLESLKDKFRNSVEVKVMTGARPEIHDRFLVIDDKVWLSGISLNEIGRRGAILIKLPDPTPILRELEIIWKNDERTKPLEQWLAERSSREGADNA